jgi:hypothetical protein
MKGQTHPATARSEKLVAECGVVREQKKDTPLSTLAFFRP